MNAIRGFFGLYIARQTMKEPNSLSKLRPLIAKVLQKTHLNKIAHKIYYGYVHGFNPSFEYPPYGQVFVIRLKEHV